MCSMPFSNLSILIGILTKVSDGFAIVILVSIYSLYLLILANLKIMLHLMTTMEGMGFEPVSCIHGFIL
jgi:hypothetical protein